MDVYLNVSVWTWLRQTSKAHIPGLFTNVWNSSARTTSYYTDTADVTRSKPMSMWGSKNLPNHKAKKFCLSAVKRAWVLSVISHSPTALLSSHQKSCLVIYIFSIGRFVVFYQYLNSVTNPTNTDINRFKRCTHKVCDDSVTIKPPIKCSIASQVYE